MAIDIIEVDQKFEKKYSILLIGSLFGQKSTECKIELWPSSLEFGVPSSNPSY